jgi:hypothetical protein
MASQTMVTPTGQDDELNAILYALHIVFVEIRADETGERSRAYADIVHNVPMMIRSGRSPSLIKEEIILKAKRHQAERYFEKLLQNDKGE